MGFILNQNKNKNINMIAKIHNSVCIVIISLFTISTFNDIQTTVNAINSLRGNNRNRIGDDLLINRSTTTTQVSAFNNSTEDIITNSSSTRTTTRNNSTTEQSEELPSSSSSSSSSSTTNSCPEECRQEIEVGLCRAAFEMYFYNAASSRCERFMYGGCGGNENQFKSMNECESRCGDC